MSISFPNISRPSYPLKIEFEDNSLKSKFEDGTVQSRPKFTRSRRTFTIKWVGLPNNEYTILDKFIRETVKYSAETFLWINPASYSAPELETLEVRISNVGNAEMTMLDKWDIELTLQEV